MQDPRDTSTDAIARILGEKLSAEWGQPIIVENKPGVGESLAVSQLKRSKPDGHTLVLSATAPMNINPWVYKDLNYDPLTDFEYIGQTTWLPYMLVTNKKKGLDSFSKKGSGQAQTDVIGGNVDMTFDTVVSTLPHVKEGRLQAIAVSTTMVCWLHHPASRRLSTQCTGWKWRVAPKLMR